MVFDSARPRPGPRRGRRAIERAVDLDDVEVAGQVLEWVERAAGSGRVDDSLPVLVDQPAGRSTSGSRGRSGCRLPARGVRLRVRHSRLECIPSRETRLASPPGASRVDEPLARSRTRTGRAGRRAARSAAPRRARAERRTDRAAARRDEIVRPTPRSRTLTRRGYAARNRSRATSATRRSLSVGVVSVWLRVMVVKSR